MIRPNYHLICCGLSDPGLYRPNNEDAFMVADVTHKAIGVHANQLAAEFHCYPLSVSGLLLAVADGLGGYRGGEVASQLAVEATVQALFVMSAVTVPPIEQLGQAIVTAHRAICQQQQCQTMYAHMASTLTAVHVSNNLLTVAQIGDSRAYLFREQELTLLTEDQTLVHQLQSQGLLTVEEAARHPNKHVITQAMGQENTVVPDIYLTPWQPEDCVLLCTDGLSSYVKHEHIETILATQDDAPTTCRRLIEAAKLAGGWDNITVLLARLVSKPADQ
jgi:PPM family protein phosphatase